MTKQLSPEMFKVIVTEAVVYPLLSLGVIATFFEPTKTAWDHNQLERQLLLHAATRGNNAFDFNNKLQQLCVVLNELFATYFGPGCVAKCTPNAGVLPTAEVLYTNLYALVVENVRKAANVEVLRSSAIAHLEATMLPPIRVD